ncbi:unnamed protein product [Effrenium voratum]|nr:unnamed protein product [Effrenium voratum]
MTHPRSFDYGVPHIFFTDRFSPALATPAEQSTLPPVHPEVVLCHELKAWNDVLRLVDSASADVGAALQELVDSVPWLLEQIENLEETGAVYAQLFPNVAETLQLTLRTLQHLGLAAMVHRLCFHSSARLVLGWSLRHLQQALQQQVSTLWWMFDIGQFSNTNSPAKHLQALQKETERSKSPIGGKKSHTHLGNKGACRLISTVRHGMFMNSTVIYRTIFPESAILDKGLLRFLLRLLPAGGSLADFGALDGQYSRWLNDTGWVSAFAFDGVTGVAEITEESVSEARVVPMHLRSPFVELVRYFLEKGERVVYLELVDLGLI